MVWVAVENCLESGVLKWYSSCSELVYGIVQSEELSEPLHIIPARLCAWYCCDGVVVVAFHCCFETFAD